MFYEQLEQLCASIGTTPTAFVKNELHLSTSKITAWKSGSIPKIGILRQISDYFNVSIGYLFDGKEPTDAKAEKSAEALTEQESRCLKALNNLTEEDRIAFIAKMEQRCEDYPPETKENVS